MQEVANVNNHEEKTGHPNIARVPFLEIFYDFNGMRNNFDINK